MRMKMVCDDRTLREISNEFLALKKAQKIRDRTLSLRFWRPPLYQLSYTPIYVKGKCLYLRGGPSGIRTRDYPVMSRRL